MFGIADYDAFCAAILPLLALSRLGSVASITAAGQRGLRARRGRVDRQRPIGSLGDAGAVAVAVAGLTLVALSLRLARD
jgi:hypothetical protein